jgi:7-cyano-7-deazaguanine reductase
MKPKHLGVQSTKPIDTLDTIRWSGPPITIALECSEFTSRCPVTGQPDFASLTITYEPGARIVETKSLKLWLWSWRERRAFNEAIVADIASAFVAQVRPRIVTVAGRFHVRGGIAVSPTCTLRRGATLRSR